MASEAPPFWWGRPDWRAYALYPLSAAYGAIARRRLVAARREPVALPVLCVGNFTVGGAGKTPVAIAVAREARRMGLVPGFLSRGHGGGFSSPQLVDPHPGAPAGLGRARKPYGSLTGGARRPRDARPQSVDQSRRIVGR